MADLLSILSQSSSSLSAHQGAAATASNNVSNVNTPGYSRQRAELAAVLPAEQIAGAFIGRGAALLTVSQARDRFLESQLPGARGQAARSAAHSDALQAVSELDPDGGAGLTAALGAFYGSLRALSQNPADPGLRQAAVSAAQQLSLTFNTAANGIEGARTGLDAKLGGTVQTVNAMAANVADLNRQIRIARASGGEPNDLLDARQRSLDSLADLTGAHPVPDANGDIGLALGNGTALVSGDRAASLSTLADPANGGHQAIQLTRADGSGPTALTPAELGGVMGGMLDARDGTLKKAGASLDTLAFDAGNAVNAVHRTGFALDGTTGRDLFTVSATSIGAARTLTVNAAVKADPRLLGASSSAATLPGDGVALLALISTESQALSGGLNAAGALSGLIADFGASAQRLSAAAEHDAAISNHLDTMREATSGVSIDEEMVNMTRAQHAYEAVLKVMTTADEMLKTLLQLK